MERQLDLAGFDASRHRAWLAWCKERVARYPVVQPHQRVFNDRINPYHFMETLFGQLADDDVVVTGNATACIVPFQTAFLKKGQRLLSAIPARPRWATICPRRMGAAVARGGKRVICLAGDGSLQINIQELQTVVHHQLPIKLFVLNNNGYLSIRLTQTNFFGRLVGEGPSSGVTFPDIVKVATAYGLPAVRLDSADFAAGLADVLATPGPVVCDVMLDPQQPFEPKTSSRQLPDGRMVSAPLEDMFPFLNREELLSNLQIPSQEF